MWIIAILAGYTWFTLSMTDLEDVFHQLTDLSPPSFDLAQASTDPRAKCMQMRCLDEFRNKLLDTWLVATCFPQSICYTPQLNAEAPDVAEY